MSFVILHIIYLFLKNKWNYQVVNELKIKIIC